MSENDEEIRRDKVEVAEAKERLSQVESLEAEERQELEEAEEQLRKDEQNIHHGADFQVTVYNEDDGTTFVLKAGPGTLVRTVIEEMYSKLRRDRQPNDRLYLKATGEDIFAKSDLHMSDAFGDRDLLWEFAGDTGGA